MLQRLLIVGIVSFVMALIDSINTNATSFSDLHWWGKLFCSIVCLIIVSLVAIVVIGQIKR